MLFKKIYSFSQRREMAGDVKHIIEDMKERGENPPLLNSIHSQLK